ncbi:MAG: hypothetical protein O2877_01005 [bacterium]|nr:hypothetical protein [bacterium]
MTRTEWITKLEYIAKTSTDLVGDVLIANAEFMHDVSFHYFHPKFHGDPFTREILADMKEAHERKTIRDTQRYLRKQNYIENRTLGNSIIQLLTINGELRRLERQIQQINRMLPADTYSVMTFDIPEDTKDLRLKLRGKLKSFCFEQHQRSVWISTKDCSNELAEYIKLSGAEKWVSVFEATLRL